MKYVKKQIMIFLSSIIVFSIGLTSTVFAAESYESNPGQEIKIIDGIEFYLIEQTEYYDPELDLYVTDNLYSSANPLIAACSASGSLWHTKSSTYYSTGNNVAVEYWVKGYFTYDGETCYVSSVTGGYTLSASWTFIGSDLDFKSDQGSNFLLGNKYAYAKYSLVFRGITSADINMSVRIEVNCQGSKG